MDFTTFIGITIAVSCVLLGQWLEGGHVGSLIQLTAAVIVIGGTAGAVIAQFPSADLRRAIVQSRLAFASRSAKLDPLVPVLVRLARKSRREGLLSLEDEAGKTKDLFFQRAILQLIDGTDPATLRGVLDTIIDQERAFQEPGPRMWDAAGGYAPTVGILGAVLGLIHVMENLDDPSKLGSGIAVAFVATVYGVASANLVFLPIGQKLRMKMDDEVRRKELITDGICAIQEGVNPNMIERRLHAFLEKPPVPGKKKSRK